MVVKQPQQGQRPATSGEPSRRDLGIRLRALRQARGYSLARVAQGANLSPSFLSLVETGQRGISISRLMRLMQFYGVKLGDLVAEPRAEDDPHNIVIRDGEGHQFQSTDEGITLFLLARDTSRAMMPGLFVFDPSGHSFELTSHQGEEFVYVLEGEIQLTVEPAEPKILSAGDSAYFRAEQPHMYRNVASEPAKVIAVVTPPSI